MFLNLVLKEFKNGALFDKLKKKNFLSLFLNFLLAVGFQTKSCGLGYDGKMEYATIHGTHACEFGRICLN